MEKAGNTTAVFSLSTAVFLCVFKGASHSLYDAISGHSFYGEFEPGSLALLSEAGVVSRKDGAARLLCPSCPRCVSFWPEA